MENIVVETGTSLYPIYFTDDFCGLREAALKCGYEAENYVSSLTVMFRLYI